MLGFSIRTRRHRREANLAGAGGFEPPNAGIKILQPLPPIADSKTGAKVVYLNAPARALLQELPRIADSPRVIPGMRADSAGPAIDKVWSRVRKAAGLADVRLHDLRHSFASVGAAGGLSLPIIGALLGHKHATTARYAHLSADPLRAANDAVGAKIAAAMSRRVHATASADVVDLPVRRDEAGR
jgi:integrase